MNVIEYIQRTTKYRSKSKAHHFWNYLSPEARKRFSLEAQRYVRGSAAPYKPRDDYTGEVRRIDGASALPQAGTSRMQRELQQRIRLTRK